MLITGKLKKSPVTSRYPGFYSLRSLSEVREELYPFTPALLFLGGLGERPFEEYLKESNRELEILFHRFDQPFFRGMAVNDDPDWNHALWFVRPAEFRALDDYLRTIVHVDPANKYVARIGAQDVTVQDPFSRQPTAVTLYALDTNRGIWAANPNAKSHPVTVSQYPATAETLALAKDLLSV